MKLFISADIEGCAGWAFREEGHVGEFGYDNLRRQMTREVRLACEVAHATGAKEIVVKDGHGGANNIDPLKMPHYVTLIRGKSGHPYNMMVGLDSSFDAVAYIGYHAASGDVGFSGSHTSTGQSLYIRLNGAVLSECMLNSYTALSMGVPPIFLAGDRAICEQATRFLPFIETAETKHGVGGATYCESPVIVEERIKDRLSRAIRKWQEIYKKQSYKIQWPESFTYEVTFKDWQRAYKMSFYPGMEQVDDFTIRLISKSWLDIITAHSFIVY
ncbi:M55 family metallopeptidase [Veillonella criceti]|uniref:D-aminopeptidase n=1 Tax=Veillonella criceti TaxID=103891 RepID=A0A380NLN9_9FIRM|nr:M55 family metallopeptidase [Veillonella criceti]SUP43344.1 D-aminopeptidase [Veillonella criceti]